MHWKRCPGLVAAEIGRIRHDLLSFDSGHWLQVRLLSLALYGEVSASLNTGEAKTLLDQRPRVAVVMPLHCGRRELLQQALTSLHQQVGVAIECLISIDGERDDLLLVEELLKSLHAHNTTLACFAIVLSSQSQSGDVPQSRPWPDCSFVLYLP